VKYGAVEAVICEAALFSNITTTMWSKVGTVAACALVATAITEVATSRVVVKASRYRRTDTPSPI
jgi:hypothetical protein